MTTTFLSQVQTEDESNNTSYTHDNCLRWSPQLYRDSDAHVLGAKTFWKPFFLVLGPASWSLMSVAVIIYSREECSTCCPSGIFFFINSYNNYQDCLLFQYHWLHTWLGYLPVEVVRGAVQMPGVSAWRRFPAETASVCFCCLSSLTLAINKCHEGVRSHTHPLICLAPDLELYVV